MTDTATGQNQHHPQEGTDLPWDKGSWAQRKAENFGTSLKELRLKRGLTLNSLGKMIGVPAATLSRIENNKMSPTLRIVLHILSGLDITMNELLATHSPVPGPSGVSISRFKQGQRFSLRAAEVLPLHADFNNRAFGMHMIVVNPIPSDEEPELLGHSGQEFFCMLEGEMMLKIKGQPPITLKMGDTAYFESTQPHIYVALNNQPAYGLVVYYNGSLPNSMKEIEFLQQRWNDTTQK